MRERLAPRGPKRVMLRYKMCVVREVWVVGIAMQGMKTGSFILPDVTEGFSEEVTMKLGFEV